MLVMQAAVAIGDAQKLAEMIGQDPGFDVNMDHGGVFTLLHHACQGDSRSAVIPLLLAHPDIDVNVKNKIGSTSFYYACYGRPSCVREMLKDSRVKVNEPAKNGHTPLWIAAYDGHLYVIKWWIASGREMDLGKPGDGRTDAIGAAKEWRTTGVVTLLERFKQNPEETRHAVRLELGWYDEAAAEMFAIVVFVSDGLLQIKETTIPSPAGKFFSIAAQLPLELQMVLCYRVVRSPKEIIPGKESEAAFKALAERLLWCSLFTSLEPWREEARREPGVECVCSLFELAHYIKINRLGWISSRDVSWLKSRSLPAASCAA